MNKAKPLRWLPIVVLAALFSGCVPPDDQQPTGYPLPTGNVHAARGTETLTGHVQNHFSYGNNNDIGWPNWQATQIEPDQVPGPLVIHYPDRETALYYAGLAAPGTLVTITAWERDSENDPHLHFVAMEVSKQ